MPYKPVSCPLNGFEGTPYMCNPEAVPIGRRRSSLPVDAIDQRARDGTVPSR